MEKFYVPISIILAGIFVAGALLYTQTTPAIGNLRVDSDPTTARHEVTPEKEISLVNPRRSDNRYVKGGEEPKVTIVEFSDYECPFCARVHPTIDRIVEESNGEVAWEYRHFPLPIHRNAMSSAIAAECVGELRGNDAFWNFSDFLFTNQRSLSENTYISGAESMGISATELQSCMTREDIKERIEEDMKIASTLGGGGTPFNVVVYQDGSIRAVPGALPYEQFKALVQK
jgi:protein-disulfide isomerase